MSSAELKDLPIATKVMVDGKAYTKIDGAKWIDEETGKQLGTYNLYKNICYDKKSKIAVVDTKESAEKIISEKSKTTEITRNREATANASVNYNKTVKESQNIFENATISEQNAIIEYTKDSSQINNALRSRDTKSVKEIEHLTNVIDKCKLKEDAILYRGMSDKGLRGLFGIDGEITEDKMNHLIGETSIEYGFSSTSISNGSQFGWKSVQATIIAKEGTKGMYVGGISRYKSEKEVILQRSTKYRFVGYENKGGQWHVQLEVVDQDYEKNSKI